MIIANHDRHVTGRLESDAAGHSRTQIIQVWAAVAQPGLGLGQGALSARRW